MVLTGCAYYPEHWPQARWAEDARLMREAGIRVVRLAEFAWDKMEPESGVYDFEWLDEAITILSNAGLQIVLCTPTATPPPWLTHQNPDICRVRIDGVRVSPGGRRHACANVPSYQDNSRRIVAIFAERYGQHPAVIGWQIDNEFGCGETTRCYCQHCRQNFQHWLKERYSNLDSLNAAWGTQFWGMTYHAWSHIPIPGITTEPQNPSMRLDYRRFASNSWVQFQRMQIDILRQQSPDRWITHNFMVRHWSLDYWELAKDLDFVSYDNYPHALRDPAEVAMNLDLMRSFKRRSFWIMEQQPGRVNWHPYNPPVPAGQIRLWSHQAAAHGASGIVYFRYRACHFGQEQYHAGLLGWDGKQQAAYHEAKQVAQEFAQLPPLTRPPAKVGIVFDYNDLWSIELEPVHEDFSYWNLVYDIYCAFWKTNILVDFLPRGVELNGYDTVVIPAAILIHSDEASRWKDWVAQGGRLIVTCRTGVRTQNNTTSDESLPAKLVDLVGARVNRFMTVPPEHYTAWDRPGTQIVAKDEAVTFDYRIWAEILETEQADVLFTYLDGLWSGHPAITRHTIGNGEVVYIGCWPSDFGALARNLGWIPTAQSQIQRIVLESDDGSQWIVSMNHHEGTVEGMEGFGVIYKKAVSHEQTP